MAEGISRNNAQTPLILPNKDERFAHEIQDLRTEHHRLTVVGLLPALFRRYYGLDQKFLSQLSQEHLAVMPEEIFNRAQRTYRIHRNIGSVFSAVGTLSLFGLLLSPSVLLFLLMLCGIAGLGTTIGIYASDNKNVRNYRNSYPYLKKALGKVSLSTDLLKTNNGSEANVR